MRRWLLTTFACAVCGLFAACPTNPCLHAPSCDGPTALNCQVACDVGPCSTGPSLRTCGDGTTCTVILGSDTSTNFYLARAICEVNGSSACDPSSAPAPTCDGVGSITGCSGYGRVLAADCSQAALYFTDSSCCETGPTDAGQVDAGEGDAGTDGGL